VEPIISLADWDRAQEIMASRMTHWRKSKLNNEGRARPLGSGITYCSCGKPMYIRYGSLGSHLDALYCKSRFPSGKGCGMHSIKRVDLDAAIEQTIGMLADANFMMAALEAALALQKAAFDPARAEREKALAKLEVGRKEMLAMVRKGDMTRDEFRQKMAQLENEKRALEAMGQPPAPKLHPKDIMDLISRAFGEFPFLTFAQKRALLRGAVKKIIVDGHARTITTVTISGGYLGKGANSVLHSTRPYSPQCQRQGGHGCDGEARTPHEDPERVFRVCEDCVHRQQPFLSVVDESKTDLLRNSSSLVG
jgi:hypothetical protein